MKLTRSSYYHWLSRLLAREDCDLQDRIERIVLEFPRYGYRRVTHALKREGQVVNHKRVLKIMRESDLLCVMKRKFVKTTDSKHGYPSYPNLLKGQAVTGINQVWVADITYIRILLGFVYLATILDLFSRKVVGYAISKHIDIALALEALEMAIRDRHPEPGIIHHSDHGVQYAATDYVDVLKAHGFQISMARVGNPYDNAVAESFFKTLKYEEVYLSDYETYEDVLKRVPYFIKDVYNRKRLHSSLGYCPPEEFEQRFVEKRETCPV